MDEKAKLATLSDVLKLTEVVKGSVRTFYQVQSQSMLPFLHTSHDFPGNGKNV